MILLRVALAVVLAAATAVVALAQLNLPHREFWQAGANLAPGGITDLARIARNRLKSMQYQPTLIDGFLTATGLHPP